MSELVVLCNVHVAIYNILYVNLIFKYPLTYLTDKDGLSRSPAATRGVSVGSCILSVVVIVLGMIV